MHQLQVAASPVGVLEEISKMMAMMIFIVKKEEMSGFSAHGIIGIEVEAAVCLNSSYAIFVVRLRLRSVRSLISEVEIFFFMGVTWLFGLEKFQILKHRILPNTFLYLMKPQ